VTLHAGTPEAQLPEGTRNTVIELGLEDRLGR
jgi:hypothetical protein